MTAIQWNIVWWETPSRAACSAKQRSDGASSKQPSVPRHKTPGRPTAKTRRRELEGGPLVRRGTGPHDLAMLGASFVPRVLRRAEARASADVLADGYTDALHELVVARSAFCMHPVILHPTMSTGQQHTHTHTHVAIAAAATCRFTEVALPRCQAAASARNSAMQRSCSRSSCPRPANPARRPPAQRACARALRVGPCQLGYMLGADSIEDLHEADLGGRGNEPEV